MSDSEKLSLTISEFEFNSGDTLSIAPNEIVVFVGPNNAGKSVTLKEVYSFVKDIELDRKIITSVTYTKTGSKSSLEQLLQNISKREKKYGDSFYFTGPGFDFPEYRLSDWESVGSGIKDLAPIFLKLLGTEERLLAIKPPESINLASEIATHPIHNLQKDDSLEAKFSGFFRQAFGWDLIVHRNNGKTVPLYVGDKPTPPVGGDRLSIEYIRALEKLDPLHEQGDGMKSFVGVLLNVFIANQQLFLVDEPEAFLHPPQARLLGKMLVNNLPTGRQLFVSTHSEDFLKGLINEKTGNVKVIRIIREGNINRVCQLDSSQIAEIWKDPTLRHSNVLSGLFHSKVVVCEGDGDCRFYSTVLAANAELNGSTYSDTLFINSGGKHKMHIIINALVKMNVEVHAIVDFDIFESLEVLEKIYVALGHDWSDIKKQCQKVKQNILSKIKPIYKVDIEKRISDILQACDTAIVPDDVIEKLKEVLRGTGTGSLAKIMGAHSISSGEPTRIYEEVNMHLRTVRLHVVEVGILENFVKKFSGHGPKWLDPVMEKDFVTDPDLEKARSFISAIGIH